MNPDPYRGIFGSDANRYASELQDHIDYGTSGKVAGFIAETIQVCIVYHVISSTVRSNLTKLFNKHLEENRKKIRKKIQIIFMHRLNYRYIH